MTEKPRKPGSGRPTKLRLDELRSLPHDCPIHSHRYMLFLAKKWERLEEAIDQLKAEQKELFAAAQDFRSQYRELPKSEPSRGMTAKIMISGQCQDVPHTISTRLENKCGPDMKLA